MARSLHPSANQIAAIACIGGIVGSCSFLITFPMSAASAHVHQAAVSPWDLAMVALFIGGAAVVFFAASDLESGIAAQRWSEPDIERLRALFSSRPYKALSIALIVIFIGFFALTVHSIHTNRFFWSFWLLVQTLLQLRNATLPKPANAQRQQTWENLRPLQSSHWGER